MKKLVLTVACACVLGACGMQKDDSGMESKMSDKMETKMADKMDDKMESSMMDSGKKNESAQSMMTKNDFKLMDLEGKEHALSDYKGKKVYVKLWASWCSSCLASLPQTNTLAKELKDSEDMALLTMVAPGWQETSEDDFKMWFTSLEYKNIPVLFDTNGKFMQQLNIRAFPTNVFINTSGDVEKVIPGSLSEDHIKSELASLK